MIEKLNLKNNETARRVLELQKLSYKIEAKMISFHEIPPLKDTIESLKVCDEIFYGYYIDETLAGIISYKTNDNVLDIYRVAINPAFFRRGIAGKLIHFIEGLESKSNKAVVCTGKENLPAVKLYLKNGYKKRKDIEISNGIFLTEFEKVLSYKIPM